MAEIIIKNLPENIKYSLDKPIEEDTTGTRVGDLEKRVEDFVKIEPPTTWKEVQNIVRKGKAPLYFSIGDQFVVEKNLGNRIEELTFDIIGFDHDVPSNSIYSHSMTLQLHNVYINMAFDAPEATWFIDSESYPNGLATGTYQFPYEGKACTFTIAKVVPVNGQVRCVLTSTTSTIEGTVTTYETATSTTVLETCSITEENVGTLLPEPTWDSHTSTTNSWGRSESGSNNYSNSIIRQYINSTEDSWWSPSSNFDRPPIIQVNNQTVDFRDMKGFLKGVETDFLNIIGEVKKTTALYDEDITEPEKAYEETSEKFFLLSSAEVNAMVYPYEVLEGETYQYYLNSNNEKLYAGEDSNRVKKLLDSPVTWYLRSPDLSSASACRIVRTDGRVSYNSANGIYGIAPACAIV